jgi:hypothetical protein
MSEPSLTAHAPGEISMPVVNEPVVASMVAVTAGPPQAPVDEEERLPPSSNDQPPASPDPSTAQPTVVPPLDVSTEVNGSEPCTITIENFSEEERKILMEARDKIKKLKGRKERSRAIKTAETSILGLDQNKDRPRSEREDLSTKTRSWLKSHARVRRDDRQFVKTWTGQQVMYELDPEPVKALQTKLFEAKLQKVRKGSTKKPVKFGFWRRALERVWKTLSPEEKAQHRATAELWNQTGPCETVKAR